MKGIKISKKLNDYQIMCSAFDLIDPIKLNVQGYKVTFAGYEEFEFFLHRTDGMWRLSEETTGKYICGDTLKSGLVSFAGVMIRQLSPAELKAKIAEELKS